MEEDVGGVDACDCMCVDRSTIGVVATAVDGGSTLRAAVASRMRNQRQRYGIFRGMPC